MGGVSRYFSKVLGSGVDLTLLRASATPSQRKWGANPVCNKLRLEYYPIMQPADVQLWQQVHHVIFCQPERINFESYTDLRLSVWETLQEVRVLPLFDRGSINHYILIPMGCSYDEVHWSRGYELDKLACLDDLCWLAHRTHLPSYFLEAIRRAEDMDRACAEATLARIHPGAAMTLTLA